MANLIFIPETHTYLVDGVEIPSVTQIIKAAGLSDFSKVNAELLERSANFGNAVHKVCELDIKGTLDESSLDKELVPYLNAWRAFKEDFGFIVDKTEYRSYHLNYKYGLTVDLLGRITKGKYRGNSIGDIKSGSPVTYHKYQLAAYKMAHDEINNTFILYLNPVFKPDGYKIIFSNNDKKEQNIFMCALTIFNVRKEHNLL